MQIAAQRKHLRWRGCRGSIMAEFVVAAITLVFVALIGLNLGITLFAAWINDAACREAVRAASQQKTAATALSAANISVAQFKQNTAWFSGPNVVPTGFQYETFPDKDGNYQRSSGPFVKVTTSLAVKFPAPIVFHDAKLTDQFTLLQAYCFPLVLPDPVPPK